MARIEISRPDGEPISILELEGTVPIDWNGDQDTGAEFLTLGCTRSSFSPPKP